MYHIFLYLNHRLFVKKTAQQQRYVDIARKSFPQIFQASVASKHV